MEVAAAAGRASDDGRRFANLFHQVALDCKGLPPLVTELMARGGRLADQLRLTAESLAAFLSSVDRLAARAEGGRGFGGKQSGEALASFAASHRTAPAFLGRISELLSGQALVRVKAENEMFKRNITEREKEKKEQQIEKQVQRRGMEGLVARKSDLEADCKKLEQKQREALADVKAAERKHLHSVTTWLVPVVEQELGFVAALEDLGGVLQQLETRPAKDNGLAHLEETLEENGMGSRTTSISSLTSIVSLMSPISPSPLFNRREEREAIGKPLRSRSASICDLVSNFNKSPPEPLREHQKENPVVDDGYEGGEGERARRLEAGRPG